MLQRLFREALRFLEQARADGLDPDAGGLPVVARQLLVDGYQDVPQRARFGASKAILVQVPEDLDIGLADRCRLRRDPFQYRFDDHVAGDGLAQGVGVEADAFEVGW
jgi:hypothetical protein